MFEILTGDGVLIDLQVCPMGRLGKGGELASRRWRDRQRDGEWRIISENEKSGGGEQEDASQGHRE